MTQINFGDDLTSQLTNEKGAQARKPLKTWFISPINVEGQTYYLHVEKLTGLLVITKELSSFTEVFAGVLYSMGFLTEKQQDRIFDRVVDSVQYRYNPDETSSMIAVYKQCIHDHQAEITKVTKAGVQLPEDMFRYCALSS